MHTSSRCNNNHSLVTANQKQCIIICLSGCYFFMNYAIYILHWIIRNKFNYASTQHVSEWFIVHCNRDVSNSCSLSCDSCDNINQNWLRSIQDAPYATDATYVFDFWLVDRVEQCSRMRNIPRTRTLTKLDTGIQCGNSLTSFDWQLCVPWPFCSR